MYQNTPYQSGSNYQSGGYQSQPNELRGADIIAEYLVREKVPYILGYAGHGAIGLLDGIYSRTDRIRHISPRIEQCAGFMADVYFRLTRQPLAVYASTGPGPMNMMITLANAYYDNSAFFLITGQVPTTQIDSGALQDDYRYRGDMSDILTPVVKKSWRIRKVEDLCKALPDAFSLIRTGRPGPVHLDIPYDLYIKTAPSRCRNRIARTGRSTGARPRPTRRWNARSTSSPGPSARSFWPAAGSGRARPSTSSRRLPNISTCRSIRASWARARCRATARSISASPVSGASIRRRKPRAMPT